MTVADLTWHRSAKNEDHWMQLLLCVVGICNIGSFTVSPDFNP